MFDLLKVSENYNCHLPKIGKLTVTGSFDLPKVRKITKVTHPKLVKVTSTLFDFDVNPGTWFHERDLWWIKALKIASSYKKYNIVFIYIIYCIFICIIYMHCVLMYYVTDWNVERKQIQINEAGVKVILFFFANHEYQTC